ncbi:MAG: MMPL family transporter [Proteobacteria bacterium]|nr:MMPL family transporter [Pseudomonadota bacterium]
MSGMKNVFFIRRYLRYVVDHPLRVLAVIFLVTLAFAIRLPDLHYHSSIYDLVIEDRPEAVYYKSFKEKFGTEELILVVARTENVFAPKTFAGLERLAEELGRIDGVQRVISLPGIKNDMELGGEKNLSEFARVIKRAPVFDRSLISRDGKVTALTLILADRKDKAPVIRAVEETIERNRNGRPLYQIGLPVVSQALADYTVKDFLSLPPLAFAVICLALLLLFRSLSGLLVPAASVVIALIWSFGLMAWTGVGLSMTTIIVPIFLIAVGTAYCMHVIAEYRHAVREAPTPAEAAFRCMLSIGFPSTLAVATTIIGLASLFVNRTPSIREFAFFACFGILSMLVLIFTFVPAILARLPENASRPGREDRRFDIFDRVLELVVRIDLNHQKTMLLLVAGVTLLAILGITRIRVENNPVEYFRADTPISRHFHDIYKDLSGSFPINVVVSGPGEDYFEDPARLETLARFQGFLATLDGVDKTISLVDYLRLVRYATNGYKPEAYSLPEEAFEIRLLKNNFMTMLGRDLFERFMDPDLSTANIALRTRISSTRDCLALEKEILEYARSHLPRDMKVRVTGFGLVMAHSAHLLTRGQVQSLSLTLVLVSGIMILLFLSLRVGLVAMVPNLFPIIVNFGLMGWLGVELSAVTSLIASIAIGLAVDDTIHYMFRYDREFLKDLDKERALKASLRHVGRPIMFTTVAISLGFAVVMFSSFQPTAAFGLLMVVTMISALIGDLFLLPALMQHMELVTIWDLIRMKLGQDPRKGMPLFQGLKRHQVHYVLMAGALKSLEPGEVLFFKGDRGDSMYAILSGWLELVEFLDGDFLGAIHGPKKLITGLGPGQIAGATSMLRSCRRSASVVATTPVELLKINPPMIKRLQWLYPPTARKFLFNLISVLCERIENSTTRICSTITVDHLTGLKLKFEFLADLEKEAMRSRRHGLPLSFFIMEIDEPEELKGQTTREAYQQVLRQAASIVCAHIPEPDTACRWGLLQIGVMSFNTDAVSARAVCERIAQALRDHHYRFGPLTFTASASFGLATLDPGSNATAEDLLRWALRSLESASEAGGDRIMVSLPADAGDA